MKSCVLEFCDLGMESIWVINRRGLGFGTKVDIVKSNFEPNPKMTDNSFKTVKKRDQHWKHQGKHWVSFIKLAVTQAHRYIVE